MDPRTSSKVTAPDLLEAFRADTGGVGEAVAESDLKVFVVFSMADQIRLTVEHKMSDFDEVMRQVKSWLEQGDGFGVLVVVGETEPAVIAKARDAISASDD